MPNVLLCETIVLDVSDVIEVHHIKSGFWYLKAMSSTTSWSRQMQRVPGV